MLPVVPAVFLVWHCCGGDADGGLYGAVVHRQSGEVYLEGKLERGIVPEESVWEHGGGVGEVGCTLYLHKMNLELLRR